MDTYKNSERIALGNEVSVYNALLFLSTFGVMIAMLVYRNSNPQIVGVLGVAWVFSLVRFEYLIQRIGAYLRLNETEAFDAREPGKYFSPTWEKSPQRKRGHLVLAVADAGCMLPNLLMFFEANYKMYLVDPNPPLLLAWLFFIGIALFIRASMMFKH